MKFSDLNFQPHGNYPDTGIAARHFFPNGYGISVVQFTSPYGSGGSYGADEGLYESAVLKKTEDSRSCTTYSFTDDVLGHQTEEEVEVLLHEIENLTY